MPNLAEDPDGRLRAVVDHLGYDLDPSILIGGWATHIRIGGEISKDIDLIVTESSRHKMKDIVHDLSQNSIHQGRKYRGEVSGVHVDIYVPHESQLGARLRLRVETLMVHTDADTAPPWLMLTVDAHFVTKLAALLDRHHSEKGSKDARELIGLLQLGVDPIAALAILAEATAGEPSEIPTYVADMFRLIPSLTKLSKAEQRQLGVLQRAWTQAALAYKSTGERPDRIL